MHPSIQKAKSEYQIQISQKDYYPFTGLKHDNFHTTVKLTLPFSTLNNNQDFVSKICKIQNQHMIKIIKIIESHLRQTFTIVYEYVPYKINHQSVTVQQNIKNGKYKADLLMFFRQVLSNGIQPVINAQNFGFTSDSKIKIFIRSDWLSFNNSHNDQDIEQAAVYYVNQCEKLFQSKESTQQLKMKVTGLSQKLKKIQKQIQNKQSRKKSAKIFSSEGKNSSENSDSIAKTGKNVKIGNAQWIFDHDFHFQDSYSVRDSKKRKRTSSFKFLQKPKSENKHKKASWEASCKQQKSSNVQSDKVTVLKKRISEALFKTKKTLNKYQKIRNKPNKRNSQAMLSIPQIQ